MSLRRILALAFKEFLQVWRDPRSLSVALLMPLMQMVLLGYGVSLDIRRVPLCVEDQENSATSHALVQDFIASGWFAITAALPDEALLRPAMDRGQCIAAMVIPVDFSRMLADTGQATVQTIFDATDTNTTNIAIGYAQGVIAARLGGFRRTLGGLARRPARPRRRRRFRAARLVQRGAR